MSQELLYKEKDIVEGIITSVKKYGIFLSFEGAYAGLLHISEISDNFVNNIDKHFHCGDTITVYVKNVDLKTKFLSVSLKRLPDELNFYKEIMPSKKITSYLKDIDFTKLGKSLPSMIKEELERENKDESKN